MKKLVSLVILSFIITNVIFAQSNKNDDDIIYATADETLPDSLLDSLMTVELKEVTVSGASMIRKSDRKLLFPTANQIKLSKTGTDVLKSLQLPEIVVNPLDNAISLASQGKLQLRVNGREVSSKEILSLNPESIIRVEYHDNPSVRFGDADAVINFIVNQPKTGGNLILDNAISVNRGWANNFINAKVNHKDSEFGISFWGQERYDFKIWRDNTEKYVLNDGKSFERIEEGIPTYFALYNSNLTLSYSLLKNDKYFLSVMPSLDFNRSPRQDFVGKLTNTLDNSTVLLEDYNYNNNMTPKLDTYFQYNLDKDKLLIFNLIGMYGDSKSERTYKESTLDENPTTLVDIKNNITSNTYTLFSEGDYEQSWDKTRLTAGVKYSHTWADNLYHDLNIKNKLRNSELYGYGEVWRKFSDKLDITLGLGVSSFYTFQENTDSKNSVISREKLNIRFNPNKNSTIRLEAYNYGTAPTLSQLSNVEQKVDDYQVSKGNPNLKTFQTYYLELSYEYFKDRFYGKIRGRYWNHNNPIMGEKYWDNGVILNTYNNQKNLQELYFQFQTRYEVIKDWASITGNVIWHRYMSHGNDYTHTLNNFSFYGNLRITHWGFTLENQITNNYKMLWGETIQATENIHVMALSYNFKKVNVYAGATNPFVSNYSIPEENLNKYAGYKRSMTTKGVDKLIFVGFSYNLNWGRQHKSGDKRINNDIKSESVKASGK